jgi:hypothetical protein
MATRHFFAPFFTKSPPFRNLTPNMNAFRILFRIRNHRKRQGQLPAKLSVSCELVELAHLLNYAHSPLNLPIYTHYGASAGCSTNSHETGLRITVRQKQFRLSLRQKIDSAHNGTGSCNSPM